MEKMFCCRPRKTLQTVAAPPSKSVLQRVVAGAVFCSDEVRIPNSHFCDDVRAALAMAQALGVQVVENEQDIVLISTQRPPASAILNAGDSALAFRMFLPIAASFGGTFHFQLGETLHNRPTDFVAQALKQSGIDAERSLDCRTFSISGQLRPHTFKIDGSRSSQLLTGLLMALPTLSADSVVLVENLKSRPYIELTLNVLREFGIEISHQDFERFYIGGNQRYRGKTWHVEGDWSSGAFGLVLGAISHSVTVTQLDVCSKQADKEVLEVLKKCGAVVEESAVGITVSPASLTAFDFDAENAPDLVPPLTLLAACCSGVSTISHVDRLQWKESNRVQSLLSVFRIFGIDICYESDALRIVGGTIAGGKVSSFHDHRIAMTAAVASFVSRDLVQIVDYACVGKSYPDFWMDFFG